MLLRIISMLSPPACGKRCFHAPFRCFQRKLPGICAGSIKMWSGSIKTCSGRASQVSGLHLPPPAWCKISKTMLPRTMLMLPARISKNSRWKHENGAWKHQSGALPTFAAVGLGQTMLPRTISMLPAQIPRNLRWKHENMRWKHRNVRWTCKPGLWPTFAAAGLGQTMLPQIGRAHV